ncbi:sensor histidine kinase [Methylacidimicrobium tartarophylax]|uniref:histidine kinase n=1 Tax=Methylacidimicrobium tartarophylax TaxID=1041768 RepID=A0A5E6M7C5_9BACT|nr:ATP-binding protein [Methylacidimicrobium tartarophylax]VVM04831.1 two-component system, OmpR family, heavy metal sensor histidine kinase CusS [Methylacidimicrobium tartarophylax]
MRKVSLRWKVALLTGATVGLALALVGAVADWTLYRKLVEEADLQMTSDAREMVSALKSPRLLSKGKLPENLEGEESNLWEIDRVGGAVLYRAPFFKTQHRLAKDGFRFLSIGKQSFRVLVVTKGGYRLMLGRDTRLQKAILQKAEIAYLLSFPLALAIAIWGGWYLSGYALRPVRAIAAAAEKIGPHALHGRVEIPSEDPDLARLAQILNAMWERIEAAFEQEARLTADASHELRTPLTILRNQLEAALTESKGRPFSGEEVFLSLLEQVKRLTTITENLLFLSHAESGQLRLRKQPVDWSKMVEEVAEDARLLAVPSGLSVASSIPPGRWISGDGELLLRLLWNLVDNAVKYNTAGGSIWITLLEDDSWLILSVSNTGPIIEAADQAEIFRRFYRARSARDSQARGSGLGLSLCREIAALHGGEIRYDNPAENWNRFTVWLPKGEPQGPGREPASTTDNAPSNRSFVAAKNATQAEAGRSAIHSVRSG